MVDDKQIYCKKCARARLEAKGLSKVDAFVMAEKIHKQVKKIVDKHNG